MFGMYNGKRLGSSSQIWGVEGDGGIKRFVLLAFQLNNREASTQGTELQAGPGCPPALHLKFKSLLGLCPHLLNDWTKSLLWHHLTKPSQPHQSAAFLFLLYKIPSPGSSPMAMSYRGSRALIRLKVDTLCGLVLSQLGTSRVIWEEGASTEECPYYLDL